MAHEKEVSFREVIKKTNPKWDEGLKRIEREDFDATTQTVRGATPKLPRQPYRDTVPAGRGSYKKPVARKTTRSGSRGSGR